MSNKIDFTETIKNLELRFKHFRVIEQNDDSLLGVLDCSNNLVDVDFTLIDTINIYIRCRENDSDALEYKAVVTIRIDGSEEILRTSEYTASFENTINYIKRYCTSMSAMFAEIGLDNNGYENNECIGE